MSSKVLEVHLQNVKLFQINKARCVTVEINRTTINDGDVGVGGGLVNNTNRECATIDSELAAQIKRSVAWIQQNICVRNKREAIEISRLWVDSVVDDPIVLDAGGNNDSETESDEEEYLPLVLRGKQGQGQNPLLPGVQIAPVVTLNEGLTQATLTTNTSVGDSEGGAVNDTGDKNATVDDREGEVVVDTVREMTLNGARARAFMRAVNTYATDAECGDKSVDGDETTLIGVEKTTGNYDIESGLEYVETPTRHFRMEDIMFGGEKSVGDAEGVQEGHEVSAVSRKRKVVGGNRKDDLEIRTGADLCDHRIVSGRWEVFYTYGGCTRLGEDAKGPCGETHCLNQQIVEPTQRLGFYYCKNCWVMHRCADCHLKQMVEETASGPGRRNRRPTVRAGG